jgi:hypothetical protein
MVVFSAAPARAAQSGQPPVWLSRYEPAETAYGGGHLRASPDGGQVAFIGIGPGADGREGFATIVYDAGTGAVLWTTRVAPSGTWSGNAMYAYDLAWSPAGDTLVVTGVQVTQHRQVAITVAFDAANGAIEWSAREDRSKFNTGGGTVVVTPDGTRVIVAGGRRGTGAGGDTDYWLAAYDAGSGATVWTRTIGYRNVNDVVTSMSLSPDGSFVIVGGETRDAAHGTDFLLAAVTTTDGTVRWRARSALKQEFYSGQDPRVLLSPDGTRVFLTGVTTRLSYSKWWFVQAFDSATGGSLWDEAPLEGGSDVIYAGYNAAITSDGATLFMTGGGGVDQVTRGDVYTLAIDTVTGAQQWSAIYNGPASLNDRGIAVAVTPDDATVVVTGISGAPLEGAASASDDDVTLAYDAATGAPRWTARYDEKQVDTASALAIALGGTVAVMTSVGGGRNADYAVIAYPIAVP